MLRKVTIQNYKSILDDTFELGRINVFIGENGCGKSNLLEALVLASAARTEHTSSEDLFNRGVRVAPVDLMRSAFAEAKPAEQIRIEYVLANESGSYQRVSELAPVVSSDGALLWDGLYISPDMKEFLDTLSDELRTERAPLKKREFQKLLRALAKESQDISFDDFVIYNANILALRGLEVISRREPLGIHGEGLDILLGTLPEHEFSMVNEAMQCIRWVKQVELDKEGERRFQGLRLGRSRSNLYFVDRFMADDKNVFSAENANEGALHVLFYLALFSTTWTPAIFGIDNIETALNPQLCRDLIKQLAILAAKNDKQALITTHNPAILDGLNLHDDDQRLFVVYRTDEGYTRTRRIKVKPDAPEPLKLSELWMRGYLGGLPQGF